MDRGFEILDISGDVGLRIRAADLEELFEYGAIGLYSLITPLNGVKAVETAEIEVEGEGLEGLFVGWLNELIFRFDTYGFIGREVEVESVSDRMVAARVGGEEFDPERHERGLLLKAATYHDLKIEKDDGGWTAVVIFDI